MSTTTLNIGLEVSQGAEVGLIDVDALNEAVHELADGVGFFGATVESHTEPTLVVQFETKQLDSAQVNVIALAEGICQRFNLDCVALFSTGIDLGVLIGPGARQWGPFDANKFFLLDGRSLATHELERAQAGAIH